MKKQLTVAMMAVLMCSAPSLHAQTTTTTTTGSAAKTSIRTKKKTRTVKVKTETAEQKAIRELQEKAAVQQSQIDALTQQNAAKDAALAAAQSTAAMAQQQASDATTQALSAAQATQAQTDTVNGLKSTVTDLQNSNVGLATTISATKSELNEKIDSPSALHYKGLTITPVAFFAFEGVYRERSVNSDINTPLNSIPFPSANEGHTSELNFSGRQSRIGGLFQANAGNVALTGYFETDFLGAGTTSNNNQSNSYVLRQRQIWGQAATKSGFAVTGGQMWSLVTEDRKGTDVRTEIQPQTIDPQYLVGYNWTRQPQIRIQQRWGDYKTGAFSAALSLEQAQITNFTANGTNPSQYFFGGLGQNGGLYNAAASAAGTPSCTTTVTPTTSTGYTTTCTEVTSNVTTYANNVAPDVIVKFAWDVPVFHAEIGGIGRFLRDQYLPVTTYGGTAATPTYTYGTTYLRHTATAGGVFGALRSYIGKPGTFPAVEVAVQGMAGTGTGRYGSAQLADATLRPDETLEPIRNYHGLFSLESHWTSKFDVFAYYGGEYAQRTVYTAPAGNLIGYGPSNLNDGGCYNNPAAPATTTIGNGGSSGSLGATTCGSPTKYIQEAMIGFQYRPIVSPKYGKLQYSATYSIINRQLWAGIGSATTPVSPRAQDSMFHVQMRYYIP
ncbi:MAG TPA: hypothetical protein VGU46_05750 [Acidobacteriaceae bacterium]|nr:hypothetical protein [Acidobacteriaceae bacterium]